MPFNIASYALLTAMIAHVTGLKVSKDYSLSFRLLAAITGEWVKRWARRPFGEVKVSPPNLFH